MPDVTIQSFEDLRLRLRNFFETEKIAPTLATTLMMSLTASIVAAADPDEERDVFEKTLILLRGFHKEACEYVRRQRS
jgi:hypothetical protein